MNIPQSEIDRLLAQADELCEQKCYAEAFPLDLKAAEAGSPRAMVHIGWYYENGYVPASVGAGTPDYAAEAFRWYNMASEQDYGPGHYCVGTCLENGTGISIDTDSALHYYTLAALQGLEDAEDAIGRLKNEYTSALSTLQIQRAADEARRYLVLEDFENARNAASPAAITGDPGAMYILYKADNKNLYWLRRASECGLAAAMADYAWILWETEPTKAFELACRVSGIPRATYLQGRCFEEGLGTTQNKEKALELYHEAAESGCEEASYRIYRLARNIEEGKNTLSRALSLGHAWACYEYAVNQAKDPRERFELFEKASAQGHAGAMFRLSEFYTGDWTASTGIEADMKQELFWLKKSAAAGYGPAYFALGLHHFNNGDYVTAKDYFLKRKDDPICHTYIGQILYSEGLYDEALQYLENALRYDPSDDTASYLLADIFYCGKGTPQNKDKAIGLYHAAAEGGNIKAQIFLSHYYHNSKNYAEAARWLRLLEETDYESKVTLQYYIKNKYI